MRAAIREANDTGGADIIRFNIADNPNISGLEVKTISPASALPTITEQVTINGYTQSGASANTLAEGNDAVLKVQLNGIDAGGVNGLVIEAPDTTIRGLVINRFVGNGVVITGSGAKVLGNFVGTNAAGSAPRGNGGDGVEVSSASDNTIGGTASGARNVISGNGGDGVTANDGDNPSTTQVDPDSDSGANNLQNFPVITSAIKSSTNPFLTTITGTLNSNPNQTYTIQCFVAVPDPSGHGEGQIPAGQDTVQTDAGGDADGPDDSFRCVSPIPQVGQVVTATATRLDTSTNPDTPRDTSEFSENVGVVAGP